MMKEIILWREYRGRMPFVQGYRECNIPVRVKGGSLAQRSVACDTPYWVIT